VRKLYMKSQFLLGSNETFKEPNIYADKSSLVLEWLLLIGIEKKQFTVREAARETHISLGQVQKIFSVLAMNGVLQTEGVRTAKKFMVKNPQLLLKNWLKYYSIVKKCKMLTYHTGIQGRERILEVLKNSSLRLKVALALHSAAEAFGCKNTNLETLELYLLEPDIQVELEKTLQLEPQERGYEVLLIEPYYKSILNNSKELKNKNKHLIKSPLLLTFLDLYQFPLRGLEQAEFMAEQTAVLKLIYKKNNNRKNNSLGHHD
jgi:hypothetical protein